MDLPSDSDDSDVDFVPGAEEAVSECESEEADKETDAQFEGEVAKNKQKRLAKKPSKKSTRKKAKISNESSDELPTKSISEKTPDPADEKKYQDDLWASFLGTPAPSKPKINHDKTKVSTDKLQDSKPSISAVADKKKLATDIIQSETLKDLFKSVKAETVNKVLPVAPDADMKAKAASSSSPVPSLAGARKSGGGLASIMGKIGKKDKVSVLEKTKLDWMSFKKEEGIEEDISIHNRGRDGYLDRQDFLQRTDVNQFEIEKSLRSNKRSNR